MYKSERLDLILEILKKNGYTSVKYLTEQLHYSNATINRDLSLLESRKLVKRSYGGVELLEVRGVPLEFRYHKMKSAKMKVARAAAALIEDGDTVFIDATTTTQYIGKYIENKKNVRVITNNMALATYLSSLGLDVTCLGGSVVEAPYMLAGIQTVENAKKLHADKMFFSTQGINDKGYIASTKTYHFLHLTMAENSDKVYYLVDKGKFNVHSDMYLFNISCVDGIISDFDIKEKLKKEYNNVEFILAK